MELTDWQEQIIWGSILGGASLLKPARGKNYYLAMRSSNRNWLEYKIQELASCFWELKLSRHSNTYRCQTMALPCFTELYGRFFQNKQRVIDIDTLSLMQDIGLAVWFIDGGGKTGRGGLNAYLNTTLWGEYGSKVVCNYFDEILEMPCAINKNKHRRRVVFSREGSYQLFGIIADKIPVFMHHRLD